MATAKNTDIINSWQEYGFACDPFLTGSDQNTYYSTPHWEEQLDLLQYLCQYNNVLLVLTGIAGIGKTTLLNEFISQVDDTMRTCYLSASGTLRIEQLLNILQEGFDLSEPTEEEDHPENLQEQLDVYLAELQESEKICVLLIDNAHRLQKDALDALLYCVHQQSENHMRLHILLAGEPQLQVNLVRLTEEEHDQHLIHVMNVMPFSQEETERYLKHRLTLAGLTEDIPFSKELVSRIYRLSEGVPGRINRIAKRTLLQELPKQEAPRTRAKISVSRPKMLWIAILLTTVISIVLLFKWLNKGDNLIDPQATEAEIAFQTPPTLNKPTAAAPVPAATPIAEEKKPADEVPHAEITPIASPTPAATPAAETAHETTPVPTPAVVIAAQSSALPIVASEPTPVAEDPAISAAKMEKNTSPSEKIEKTKPVKTSSGGASPTPAASKKRLLAIDKSRYTLQLMGLSKESSAKSFIAKNKLAGKVTYFKTTIKQKTFYILVYGDYPSLEAAKATISTLPPMLQKFKPWPRKMAMVHNAIDV